MLSEQLTSLLGIRDTVNHYKLRCMKDFSLIQYNSELGRKSVRYRDPMVCNAIPKVISDASSLQENLKMSPVLSTGNNLKTKLV